MGDQHVLWEGTPVDARLTASVLRGTGGRPLMLYWLIHIRGEPSVNSIEIVSAVFEAALACGGILLMPSFVIRSAKQ